MRVLVIEDEADLAEILQDYLQREGYQVSIVTDGDDAVDTILKGRWDLVLLDLMLPNKDGLTICTEVRKSSQVPIIMVTAKVEEIDRLIGLRLGADDYICKPYSPREVVARVEAVLRRASNNKDGDGKQNNNAQSGFFLDTETMEVHYDDEKIELTLVEFNLLKALISKPLRIHSRDVLMDIAYKDNRIVSDRTIDSHINKLRRKLKAVIGQDVIRSVYGAGYRIDSL